jgi:hypothetical protein
MSAHTISDVRLVISEDRPANRKLIIAAFTKYDAPKCLSAVDLPQLYFDQIRIMWGHIANTVLVGTHCKHGSSSRA